MKNTTFARPGQPGAVQPARGAAVNSLPFAAIPYQLIEDPRLNGTCVCVVANLLKHAREKYSCWPAVGTIARELGLSRRAVQLNLRQLALAGWISVRPAGNPTGQEYVLVWRVPVVPEVKAESLPYTQGLPRAQKIAPKAGAQFRSGNGPNPRAQPAAPQDKNERKKEGLALASSNPEKPKPEEPDCEMTPEQFRDFMIAAGRLSYPKGHPLRVSAEAAIALKMEQAKRTTTLQESRDYLVSCMSRRR